MLGITAAKSVLVLFLFVILPIALMRYMVSKTIEVSSKNQHKDRH